jgi:predicted ATPase
MLETIREYAMVRLAESSSRDQEVLQRRHTDFFLALAEQAEPLLTSGDEAGGWFSSRSSTIICGPR